MNWSLASEWFSVWGDAYRNPDRSLLMNHLKCVRDDFNNAYCKRTYKDSVTASSKDFEELSDKVKEFLSKVPNLYVEDAAVASGRFLETRIRSVTNDPVTALALKNMLVYMLFCFLILASHASPTSSDSSSSRSNCSSRNVSVFYIHWNGSSLQSTHSSDRRRCFYPPNPSSTRFRLFAL